MFKGFFKRKDKKNKIEEEKIEIAENVIVEEVEEKNLELPEEKEENISKSFIKEEIDVKDKIIEKVTEELVEDELELELKEIEEPAKEKKGLFTSLKEKLTKSREGLFGSIKKLFLGRKIIDDEMYEELEDILIQSDIGYGMTLKIVEALETRVKELKIKETEKVYEVLEDVMEDFLVKEDNKLKVNKPGLNVVLVVGVNGVGKTTTIGKMAAKLKNEGKEVVVGAADTFRAAAIEQLQEWGKIAGVEVIAKNHGTDPGAVVFDTLKEARMKKADVAIIDTAGRLHNKSNLMSELGKINKIIKKEIGENTEYESILVIDGTTGQNGLTQAKVFNEVTELSGFVITKLDGTAKGGIIFSISEEIKKPIKFIGVGEGIDDLREFNPDEFIRAIFN